MQKPTINKIISPNLGHPSFIKKENPEFKVIIEVNAEWTMFAKKPLLREDELLKEAFKLESIDKSETLTTNIIKAQRIGKDAIQDYLNQNINSWLYDYYELTLKFNTIPMFKNRRFKLYNLICGQVKTNHSVCILNPDWNDMSFIHITDTHIATRWDTMESEFNNLFSPISSETETVFRQPEFYNLYDSSLNAVKDNLINPNTNLKEFIKQANKLAEQNKLDCIVLTGDIVDFAAEDILELKSQGLCKNWELFINIVLGKADNTELKVPLITIQGNHDCRLAPFRLVWAGLQQLGISRQMQNTYFNRVGEFRRIKYAVEDALSNILVPLKNNLSLQFYVNNINPFFNFNYAFGSTHFVLLDTGQDNFTYFKNYFGPRMFNMLASLTRGCMVYGFEKKQIQFLKSCLGTFKKDDNVILFFHAPLFNISHGDITGEPAGSKQLIMKIPKINENDPTTIREKKAVLFEAMLSRRKMNLGSVFRNPLPVIDLCLKQAFHVLAFSGHRHLNISYILDRKTRTVLLNNKEDITGKNPLFFITTALGQIGFLNIYKSIPGYRHVTVNNNKVQSVETCALDAKPYDMIVPNVTIVKQNKNHYLLNIKLNLSDAIKKKPGKIFFTVTARFTCGYVFGLYDIKLPIDDTTIKVLEKKESKIFFEKEGPYNKPIAVKTIQYRLDKDEIKLNIGRLKKISNIHRAGLEFYFEGFVKEKGKLESLGIIHYPLRLKL